MTHFALVERAARWLRGTMRCGVVLAERHSGAGETPDAIGWGPLGESHVVEVKVSRADFHRDKQKPHRRNSERAMGRYRWYLTMPGLLTEADLPERFGLVEVEPRRVRVRRPAERHDPHDNYREVLLLLSELRRYQIHGITYPPLVSLGVASMPGRIVGVSVEDSQNP